MRYIKLVCLAGCLLLLAGCPPREKAPKQGLTELSKAASPSSFALAVARSSPGSRLIAWGSATKAGSDSQAAKWGWALLVDKERVNYLINQPIEPSILEKIGDETSWSPYLLRGTITSFQMPVGRYCQSEKCNLNTNGLPPIDQRTVEDHIYLFGEMASLKMTIEGFVSTLS